MFRKTICIALALCLAASAARAEFVSTVGYAVPDAVEILVNRDLAKIGRSEAAAKELFVTYSMSFGVALGQSWPDIIDKKLSDIMFRHYMVTWFQSKSKENVEKTKQAGLRDGKLFASRFDPKSAVAQSVVITLASIVIGLNTANDPALKK